MEDRDSDLLKKNIDKMLEKALKNQVFTACSVGFFINNAKGRVRDIFNYGFAEGFHGSNPVNRETVFDLASLTKPLVTSLCLLALMEEKKLGVADTLDKFLTTAPVDKRGITISQLLTHSSGLPAHRPYYKELVKYPDNKRMKRLIAWILAEKLVFVPGTAHLYSDLGFILLGRIIEKVSGESLDAYWQRKIVQPLELTGLEKGLFFPGGQKSASKVYAGTGMCEWSKKRLSGLVHDDNCRALGGVAGHAGLFGNSDALLSLCEIIALQFRGEYQHPSFCNAKIKKRFGEKKGSWIFGFDTPTAGTSSSGHYFSELTIGHLGFTGTSFWIDLQRGIGIVLLTNRVACGETTAPIKKLRPLLHDLLMQFLIKKSA
ncbi:serine hydrolase domain-containing protein [Desulfocastanea catecholica]